MKTLRDLLQAELLFSQYSRERESLSETILHFEFLAAAVKVCHCRQNKLPENSLQFLTDREDLLASPLHGEARKKFFELQVWLATNTDLISEVVY